VNLIRYIADFIMTKELELKLKEGDKAPESRCRPTAAARFPGGFRGHNVILYFYPKDDTPGCTKEACAFRDDLLNSKNAAQWF